MAASNHSEKELLSFDGRDILRIGGSENISYCNILIYPT